MTREEVLKHDMQALLLDARFKRFMYCVLMEANVLRGYHGSNERNVLWWDGRRSIGLDLLTTMQAVDPDALLAILAEETRTRLETTVARRTRDRRDELNPNADADGRSRSDGSVFLDYAAAGGVE